MPQTSLFGLPLLAENQSGRVDLIHNEAIDWLELLSNATIADRDLTAPPASPSSTVGYIPAASATGAWASKENKLAFYRGSVWRFFDPPEGFRIYLQSEDVDLRWNGTDWETISVIVETGETIRDKLALLTGIDRLDAGAVQNIAGQIEPIQTSNFTALPNRIYRVNTSSNAIVATLDVLANWQTGDIVRFIDEGATSPTTGFGLNALTLAPPSGGTIAGGTPNLTMNTGLIPRALQYSENGRFNWFG
jgi:hypothetical protein